MKIDLNTSLKNNIHENSLTKMKLKKKFNPNKSVTSQLSDEAIHEILNTISSELDEIDNLELFIVFYLGDKLNDWQPTRKPNFRNSW